MERNPSTFNKSLKFTTLITVAVMFSLSICQNANAQSYGPPLFFENFGQVPTGQDTSTYRGDISGRGTIGNDFWLWPYTCTSPGGWMSLEPGLPGLEVSHALSLPIDSVGITQWEFIKASAKAQSGTPLPYHTGNIDNPNNTWCWNGTAWTGPNLSCNTGTDTTMRWYQVCGTWELGYYQRYNLRDFETCANWHNTMDDGGYALSHDPYEVHGESAWHKGPDHTNNAGGMMLVVNAALEPGMFYERDITGLCYGAQFDFRSYYENILIPGTCGAGGDLPINIRYEVWSANPGQDEINSLVPVGGQACNGAVLLADTNTGNVVATANVTWNKTDLIFTVPQNQDSCVIILRNNAGGGCGNDLAIDDISFSPYIPFTIGYNAITTNYCSTGKITLKGSITSGSIPGNIPYVFQWQDSISSGNTWTNIGSPVSNLTADSLVLNVGSIGNETYRLVSAASAQNFNNSNCYVASANFAGSSIVIPTGAITTTTPGVCGTIGGKSEPAKFTVHYQGNTFPWTYYYQINGVEQTPVVVSSPNDSSVQNISITGNATITLDSILTTGGCVVKINSPLTIIYSTATPPPPLKIFGPDPACIGTTSLFYVSPIPGATYYNWVVSGGGWQLISGQGTDSVQLTIGNTPITVAVTTENACGTNTFNTDTFLTTNNAPSAPATIASGPLCLSTNGSDTSDILFQASTVAGAQNYIWSVNAPVVIDSNQTQGVTGQFLQSIILTIPNNTTSFTVGVQTQNGCGFSPVKYVTFNPNCPPVARDTIISTNTNTEITNGNVSVNVSDPDGNLNNGSYTLSCGVCTHVSDGTLVFNSNGTFTYTPNTNFVGTDSFIYEVCDLGTLPLCDTAIVRIVVNNSITPPQCTAGTIASCYASAAAANAAAIIATTITAGNCIGSLITTAFTTGTCSAVVRVTVKDACGDSCFENYTTNIITAGPSITTVASTGSTVSCPSATNTAPTTLPVVTDNCGNVLSPSGPVVSSEPTCQGLRTYTYTYKDCLNNSLNWVYTYTVTYQDFSANMPANTGSTVACASAAATVPTPPTVQDNCGNTITPSGPVKGSVPSCNGTVTYTWTYTDCAGNSHPWVYTYTIQYNDFIVPPGGSSTVPCASAATPPSAPSVSDACGNPIIPTGPVKGSVPGCNGTLTYTYTYTDCASHSHTWVYTYTIQYNDFIVPPGGSSTVPCASAATPPSAPSVSDACGNPIIPTGPVKGSVPGCNGTLTYTYTYTDCANHSHNWVYTYTIQYNDFSVPPGGSSTVPCASAATPPSAPSVSDACGNPIIPTGPVEGSVPGCNGTLTYTYTYTDCAGHSHNWVYTYTIQYNDFSVPPGGSSTVPCASAATPPSAPSVSDACGNPIIPTGPVEGSVPGCNGTLTYTYTYTDCASHSHNWVYTYTIQYNDFSVPPGGSSTVPCVSAATPPSAPSVSDACGNPIIPTGPVKGSVPGCNGTLTYTYTYTDCASHSHDWVYTYTIQYQDFAANMPANTGSTVACAASITTPTPPTVTDNCGNVLVPSGPVESSVPACNGIVTFTYTYTDCAGNSHDWVYTYTIQYLDFRMPDNDGSTVSCPSAASVVPSAPRVVDNCGNILTPTGPVESTVPACNGTVTYTYTFTDCAGNSHDWVYTYTIGYQDFAANVPANGGSTVACPSAAYVVPTPPTITDNCGNVITPTGPVLGNVLGPVGALNSSIPTCQGAVTYTWTYTDCAGNSHQWVYTYTIIYQDFAANMPANTGSTVACASAITTPIPPTVTDNCGNVIIPSGPVENSVPACNGTVTFTYTYTDCAGNSHDWVYTYTIQYLDFRMPDNTGSTVACASAITTPAAPTVTDNCGNVLVPSGPVESSVPACNGTVTFTYTYTDCAGNSHDWVYTYTMQYLDFKMPDNTGSTVACASAITTPAAPTVTDNCGNLITPTGPVESSVPACNGTVNFTYTYTDCAGNSHDWVYTYTIQYLDFKMPDNTGSTVACASAIVTPTAPLVTDNCGNILTPTGPVESSVPACNGAVTFTYTYTDCAGNSHDWVYTYTIQYLDFLMPDNTGSTVACASAITTPAPPVVTDNCGNPITPAGPVESSVPACNGTVTFTYTYTDCAGNSHDWVYTYTIKYLDFRMPDNDGSTVACPSAASVVPSAPRVVDNCGNILVPTGPVESSVPACNGQVTYTYTFTDCAGNSHQWVYTYTIQYQDFVSNMPANTGSTVACASAMTTPTPPAVNDNCGNAIVPAGPVVSAVPACQGQVTYTYTYTDCAGNSHDWVYTYTIQYLPFGPIAPNGSTVSCPAAALVAPSTPTVYDNCGNMLVPSAPVVSKIPSCGGQVTYTYTYTDCAGNSQDFVYTYTIQYQNFAVNLPPNGGSTVNCPAAALVAPTPPVVNDNCGFPLAPSGPVVSPIPSCQGQVTYTYTYTDCAGNSQDWVYTYTIQYLPFGSIAPGGTIVSCPAAALVAPSTPTVYDNCGNLLIPTGPAVSSIPACNGQVTYTYTYTDCAGNSQDYVYTYTILYQDFVSNIPANTGSTVACASAITTPAAPSVTDNCGNLITPTGPVESSVPACNGTVTFTYTYTDCAGNSHDWVYTYTIKYLDFRMPDNDGSTVACPSAASVVPSAPRVVDNCGNILVPTGPVESSVPACNGQVTYTYTFTDCAGNSHDWVYTYTIKYQDFAANMPANTGSTVACASAITTPAAPTVTDNCGNLLVPTGPVESSVPACNGTVTFTYTYTDCAGNSHDWVYTYTIQYLPFGPIAPNGSTVSCPAAALVAPATPTVYDNCGNLLVPSAPVVSKIPSCGGQVTYTYTYTDCAGNTQDYVYTYTIQYQNFAVNLPPNGGSTVNCPAAALVAPTPPVVNDNCGFPLAPSGPVVSPIPSCQGQVTYTYTYTDCAGNSQDWVYTYTIQYLPFGSIAPGGTIVSCPAAALVAPSTPTVYDNCGNLLIPTGPAVSSIPACNGQVTYTYTYTDCAGNSQDYVYTYTILYQDFVSNIPANTGSTVACASAITTPAAPSVTDNCGNLITPTGPVESSVPACNGTVTFTYTYTDCAGNSHDWVYTYTIKYLDFRMPDNDGSTVACPSAASVVPSAPRVVDNCGNILVPTGPVESSVPACNGQVTYTYTFTDCAGNSHDWVYTYTIKYQDFAANMPANTGSTVACASAITTPAAPTVTDNCGNLLVPTGPVESSVPACNGTVTFTYTYTDCAGNSHDWVYTYTIQYLPFGPIAPNGSTVSCPAAALVAPATPTVYDNCGNLLVPSAPVVSKIPSCGGQVTYTYTYTDCAGNTQDYVYTYTIQYQNFAVNLPPNGGSTVNCPAAALVAPTPPVVNDNCGFPLAPSGPVVSPIPSCQGQVTYTYTYTDCAGNSQDWVYTYTIQYLPFGSIAPGGTIVSCPAAALVAPSTPTVYDNCGNLLIPTGPAVSSIPACNGQVTYTYTYTDCAGNSQDYVYTYTILYQDFVSNIPANTGSTVACASAITTPAAPSVTDNCGNLITPTGPVESSVPACNGTVTFTYTYTDCAGNSHDWVYTYTIKYLDFRMPDNDGSTVACPSAASVVPSAPRVVDNCGNILVPTGPVESSVPACNGQVTYTYTFTDCAGNSHDWVYTYTIKYQDFAANMPANTGSTVACASAITTPAAPTVTDNCGNLLVPTGPVESSVPACNGTVTFTYTYTDCAGNSHDWVYTYTIQYLPFGPIAPNGSTVSCPAAALVAPATPTVYDNCGNLLVPSAPVVSKIPSCGGQVTYTYTYTDCAGNTQDYVYTYTIQYQNFAVNLPPNGGSTVNCPAAALVAPTPPVVNDNCGFPLAPSGPVVSPIPSCQGQVTYTYTYTDCAGNSQDWVYTYTIQYLPFGSIAPGGTIVSCPAAALVAPSTPTVYDNCGNLLIPTGPAVSSIPACNGQVTYTYTYTDCAGNSQDYVYTYTILYQDFVSNIPANTGSTVACASAITTPAAPSVTDNCGNLITPTGPVESSVPACNGTVTFTYTYTDCAGNSHDWVYTYTIKYLDFRMPDNDGSTVACPSAASVVPSAPRVVDNCGNILVPTGPVESSVPACNGQVTYTYTFTDCAGNSHDWVYTYTIKYQDFAANMPANTGSTVACASAITTPAAPTVTDNCGNLLVPTGPVESSVPACNGTVTFTYTYTDCAGNSHDWVYTYTIQYLPFGPIAPNGSTVSCPAAALVAPATPTVYDNCGNLLVPSAPVVSKIPSCGGQVTYTYTYTDCAGNTQDYVYTYTIQYQNFAVNLPPNGGSTVNCPAAALVAPTPPVVNDNCGFPLTPSGPVVSSIPACNGQVTYTYTYTDCAGNSQDWVYTYTIQYLPFGSIAPGGTTVSCPAAALVAPSTPTVYDNCGNLLIPTGPVVSSIPACNGQVTYTYTYTDCAGNSQNYVYTYTIQYADFKMPDNGGSIVNCPAAATAMPSPPKVVDNCGNVLTPVGPRESSVPSCNGQVTYTWIYTDCAGNSHPWVYTYTIQYADFALPPNGGSTVNCYLAASNVPTPPGVVDNCGNTLTPTGPVATAIPACHGTMTYTWTYTDCAGHSHNWVYTYTVNDNVPPTAVCKNISISLVNGTASITAAQVDGGSYDNCGGVTLSVNPSTFNCNNFGQNTVVLTVTDACNNTSACNAIVTVLGNKPKAVCKADTVTLDNTGNACITPADVDGGSSSTCGKNLSVVPNCFTCANVGITNVVTLYVTDNNGDIDSCKTTVVVKRNPTVAGNNCPQPRNLVLDCGVANLTPPVLAPGGSCGRVDRVLTKSKFSCRDIGQRIDTIYSIDRVAGDTLICQWMVNVKDSVGIGTPGHDTTIACSSTPAFTPPVIESCYTLQHSGPTRVNGRCDQDYQLVMNWWATDSCGTSSKTVTQTITLVDTTAPKITKQATGQSVACGSSVSSEFATWLSNHAGATATSNCGSALTWSCNSNATPPATCGCVTVVFTAKDNCGNTATTSAQFCVSGAGALTLTTPAANDTVPCCTGVDPCTTNFNNWCTNHGGYNIPTCQNNYTNWCNSHGYSNSGPYNSGNCENSFNNWIQNNGGNCNDPCNPSVTCTSSFKSWCQGYGTDGHGTQPDCFADYQKCFNSWCSSHTSSNAPCNSSAYNAWLSSHGGAMATDNCSSISWTYSAPSTPPVCCSSVTVTFTASDACGNTATTAATFNVGGDGGNLKITTQAQNDNVACGSSVSSQFSTWLSNNGGAVATDNGPVTWSKPTASAPSSCGCITVTFTASDACGNTASTSAQFCVTGVGALKITAPAANDTVPCCTGVDPCTTNFNNWCTNHGGYNIPTCQNNYTNWCNSHGYSNSGPYNSGNCENSFNNWIQNNGGNCNDPCNPSVTCTSSFKSWCQGYGTDGHGTQPSSFSDYQKCFNSWCSSHTSSNAPCNSSAYNAWLSSHGGAMATDNCSSISWTYSAPSTPPVCCSSVTVTFTASDACGNTATTAATFNVGGDGGNLKITTQAQNDNVACGSSVSSQLTAWINNHGGAVATDNGPVTWSKPTVSAPSSCGCVTVTFTASDACGNTASTSAQFCVSGAGALKITTPAVNQSVACGSSTINSSFTSWLHSQGGATATDNCSAINWSNNCHVSAPSSCGCVTVVFTASDACGNTATTSAQFCVNGAGALTITTPAANDTVACCTGTDPCTTNFNNWCTNHGGYNIPTCQNNYTNWCNSHGYSNSGPYNSGNCENSFNNWIQNNGGNCNDPCNPSVTCTSSFKSWCQGYGTDGHGTQPSSFSDYQKCFNSWCSSHTSSNAPCNSSAYNAWLSSHGGAMATDNCSSISWTYSAPSTPPVCCSSVTVTFTASDACGNTATTAATFNVGGDGGNLKITTQAQNDNVACGSSVSSQFSTWLSNNGGAVATDNGPVTWSKPTASAPSSCGCITVTFTASDACGNTASTSAQFCVTGVGALKITAPAANDTVPCCTGVDPCTTNFNNWCTNHGGYNIPTCQNNYTNWCNSHGYSNSGPYNSGNCENSFNNWIQNNGGNCNDPCNPSVTCTSSFKSWCQGYGTDGHGTQPSSFSDYQKCFNSWCSSHTSSNAPCNSSAYNAWLSSHGGAMATDNCSSISWTYSAPSTPPVCCSSVTVTFTASDACGNTATTAATFNVGGDGGNLKITTQAQNDNVACGSSVSSQFSTWLSNNGGAVATDISTVKWSNNSNGIPPSTCACATVVFTASDACGNTATTSAQFCVGAAPYKLNVPANDTVASCQSQAAVTSAYLTWLGKASVTGGCSPSLSHSTASPMACGGTVNVIYTVTDVCGNSSSASAGFTVRKAPPVVFNCAKDTTVSSCQNQVAVTAAFNSWLHSAYVSGGCNPKLTNTGGTPSACGGVTTVTFNVSDSCGYSNSCSVTFTVNYPASRVLHCAADTTVSSCQNQTAVTAAFNSWLHSAYVSGGCSPSLTNSGGTPLACGGTTTVTFNVTDSCGYTNSCIAHFVVRTAPAIQFTCAKNDTVNSCQAQSAVVSEFNTWLGTASVSGGCNPKLTNSGGTPSACGGTTTVTFNVTDSCGYTNSCIAHFVVRAAPAIQFTCAKNDTVPGTLSQDSVNTLFAKWLSTASVSGGCNPVLTNTGGAPVACGSSDTVTFFVTDSCRYSNSCTAYFVVSPVTYTIVDCPAPRTLALVCGHAHLGPPTIACVKFKQVLTKTEFTCADLGVTHDTLKVTDAAGNTTICTWTITVTDTVTLLTPPGASAAIYCPSTPTFTAPTTASCNTLKSYETLVGDCPNVYTKYWYAVDSCGVSSDTVKQSITVLDTVTPTVSGQGHNGTVACGVTPVYTAPVASDNCYRTVLDSFNTTTTVGCTTTYTRWWYAVDACNNKHSDTVSQSFTSTCSSILLGQPGKDTTISCVACLNGVLPGFTPPTYTDNCCPTVTLHSAKDTVLGNCPQSYTVTESWWATDNCGNKSDTVSQSVFVNDTIAPVVFIPAGNDTTVSCVSQTIPIGYPWFKDACDLNPTRDSSLTTIPGSCPESYTLILKWWAVDHCGNHSDTVSQTINVVDTSAPVLKGAGSNVYVSCPTCGVCIPGFTSPVGIGACGAPVRVSYSDDTIKGKCSAAYSITRTWKGIDACGNVAKPVSQTITVTDTIRPTVTSPGANATIQCTQTPVFHGPTASDNCDKSPVLDSFDVRKPGNCPQSYSIIRNWYAVDACGNRSDTVSQTINVIDNTRPTITGQGATTTIPCTQTPVFTTPTASAACNASLVLDSNTVRTPGNCPQSYSLTRSWWAVDACGNYSDTVSQIINVIDKTRPTISGQGATKTVSCTQTPVFTTPTASAACSATLVLDSNTTRAPGNCPQSYSLTRCWWAVDACGNYSDTVCQTINVVDNTRPTITGQGATVTISCTQTPVFTTPTASAACSATLVLDSNTTRAPGNCPQSYSLTRCWWAVDGCGNYSDTVCQTINVVDNTRPTIGGQGANATIQCTATPVFKSPTASAACSASLVIDSNTVRTPGNCPQSYSLARSWWAVDGCGNYSDTVTQVISVIDNIAPTLTGVGMSSMIACTATPVFHGPKASDNCDPNPALDSTTIRTAGSCEYSYTVTRYWWATDACGNRSDTMHQAIKVIDNTPPVVKGQGNDSTVSCASCVNGVIGFKAPTITDNCDPHPKFYVFTDTVNGACAQAYSVTKKWWAIDACGNISDTVQQTIHVIDTVRPVIITPWTNVTDQCNPRAFSVGVSSGCNSVATLYHKDTTILSSCQFTYTEVRKWWAIDGCGNVSDTVTQTINVVDEAPTLAGQGPNEVINCVSCQVCGPGFIQPNYYIGCDASPRLTYTDTITPGKCTGAYTDKRTWTAIDACGLKSAPVSQTITVQDTTAPVLSCPGDETLACDASFTYGVATATDNCDANPTVSIVSTDTVTNNDGSITYTRNWKATDACGNTGTCSQVITTLTCEQSTTKKNDQLDVTNNAGNAEAVKLLAYPNPAHDLVTFSMTFSDNEQNVSLEIYNQIGQKIGDIFQGNVNGGLEYKVQFETGTLASGTYFYRLNTATKSIVEKLTIAR